MKTSTMTLACALFGLAATGCSHFKTTIEVYDGTGLSPPPADDPMTLFGRIDGAVAQADAARVECKERLSTAGQRANELAGDLEQLRKAQDELSKTPELTTLGKSLAAAWETFLRDLAKADTNKPAVIAAARTKLGPEAEYAFESVNIVLTLHARLRKALTATGEGVDLTNAVALAMMCEPEACAAADTKLVQAVTAAGAAGVLKLADAAKAASTNGEIWKKQGDDPLTETAAAVRNTAVGLTDCAALDAPFKRLAAARDELGESLAGKLDDASTRKAQLAVQKALAAARDYAAAAEPASDQLTRAREIEQEVSSMLDQRTEDPFTQLALAKGFTRAGKAPPTSAAAEAELREHLQGWVDTVGEPLEVAAVVQVAALSNAFRLSDPNLRVITAKANEDHWNELPIDDLDGHAEGKAQFVIVQDSPVSYRVKELHADPAKNVDLAMSVGDIGIELIGAIAGMAAPDDDDDEGGATLPPCNGDAEARAIEKRERELVRAVAALQRDLDRALRGLDGKPSAKLDSTTLAALRGTLAGHVAKLKAIRKQAAAAPSRACDTATETEEEKNDEPG